MTTNALDLPAWSIASTKRRAHIARVTALIDSWASAMRLDDAERKAWHDAARWHDALRDAPESALREIVPDLDVPAGALHGPAAAVRLAEDGESRGEVLDAIRWHTIGDPSWGRTGKALYMADFLEPGRRFERGRRALLASSVPSDFDDAFRQVVRARLAPRIAKGEPMHAYAAALWEAVQ
jgi:2-amino-4-hydroxy-6-hydroxymethyldihydropteridine diphosphokinase